MKILYGTAWKEERTEGLTLQAIAAGFRGFDSANQRKHYFEEGMGRALAQAIKSGKVKRSDLFIQTKFTYPRGQDHRLPYDANSPVQEQISQSFASSLEHLRTDYLDSYLIHGPERSDILSPNDWSAWQVMEQLHKEKKIRHLGISNINVNQLEALVNKCRVKPTYVQNRCYPSIQWDRKVRDVCKKLGITYQGFNLVVDPLVWKSPTVTQIAKRLNATHAQVIYRFALQSGMLPMTGTTNPEHMKEALAGINLELTDQDLTEIEQLGA